MRAHVHIQLIPVHDMQRLNLCARITDILKQDVGIENVTHVTVESSGMSAHGLNA